MNKDGDEEKEIIAFLIRDFLSNPPDLEFYVYRKKNIFYLGMVSDIDDLEELDDSFTLLKFPEYKIKQVEQTFIGSESYKKEKKDRYNTLKKKYTHFLK